MDPAALDLLKSLHLDGFTQKAIRQGLFTFELPEGSDASAAVQDSRIGFRLEGSEGSRVIQVRLEGFTFSAVRSYTSWAEFSAEAKEYFDVFREKVGATTVGRTAVRYINLIELPLAEVSFDDYLTSAPKIPSELPQGLSRFLQRVVIPFPVDRCVAIVTQALEPPSPSGIPVVLDIDVFSEENLQADSAQLWSVLGKLRDVKNRIFFASVTDLALKNCR
jgi:uncharacterized protein (TIGR04255 family)